MRWYFLYPSLDLEYWQYGLGRPRMPSQSATKFTSPQILVPPPDAGGCTPELPKPLELLYLTLIVGFDVRINQKRQFKNFKHFTVLPSDAQSAYFGKNVYNYIFNK